MKRLLLLVQPILFTASLLLAPLTYGLEFSCFSWKPLPYKKLYYKDGEKYQPLVVFPNSRSKTYELGKSNLFQIYQEIVTAEGAQYQLLGQSKLIENADRILFYIGENPNSQRVEKLKILPIDDSLNDFPVGSFRFINMSGNPLFISFSKQLKKIPAGSAVVIPSNANANGDLIPLMIKNEAGKTVYETRLFAQTRGRDIVFLLPENKQSGLINVKFLPQTIPPPPSF